MPASRLVDDRDIFWQKNDVRGIPLNEEVITSEIERNDQQTKAGNDWKEAYNKAREEAFRKLRELDHELGITE